MGPTLTFNDIFYSCKLREAILKQSKGIASKT